MKPLHGIKVVDLTQNFAGPQCTYQLGLLGADVVKIELPGTGDPFRHFYPHMGDSGAAAAWMAVNAGKRSLTLDLKNPKGVEILRHMIAAGDVFVQNLRPGVAERLGAGEEQARELNPQLIYCSVSGFGQTGPWSQWPAYDSPVQAMTGIMNMTKGEHINEPTGLAWVIADMMTGYATHAAVLAALYQRSHTGVGQTIDVAMLEATMQMLMSPAARYVNTGELPNRANRRGGKDNVTAMLLRTGDGGHIWTSASTDRQFAALLAALGAPEVLDDPRFATHEDRIKHVDELEQKLEEILAGASAIEWEQRIMDSGAPAGAVRTLQEAVKHPVLEERGMFMQTTARGVDHPIYAVNAPYRFEHDGPGLERGVPGLGEHTDEVLAELGYSPTEIEALHATDVV